MGRSDQEFINFSQNLKLQDWVETMMVADAGALGKEKNTLYFIKLMVFKFLKDLYFMSELSEF